MNAPNNFRMLFGLILLLLICTLFLVLVLGKPVPQINQNVLMPLVVVLASAVDRWAQWAFRLGRDETHDQRTKDVNSDVT